MATTENKAAENKPLEKVDAAKQAEAKAEASGDGVALREVVKASDLPKEKDVPRLAQENNDPNVGWTNQAAERDEDQVSFVDVEGAPGQYVAVSELPTEEGLKSIGVRDAGAYLAGVPVKK